MLLAPSLQILADIDEVRQLNSGIKLIHLCPSVSGILKNSKIGSFLTMHKGLRVLKEAEREKVAYPMLGIMVSQQRVALATGQHQWTVM